MNRRPRRDPVSGKTSRSRGKKPTRWNFEVAAPYFPVSIVGGRPFSGEQSLMAFMKEECVVPVRANTS
jgi:hypothetical protein